MISRKYVLITIQYIILLFCILEHYTIHVYTIFSERAIDHRYKILSWMSSTSTNTWESALREIIGTDSYIPSEVEIQSPRDFFRLCN